MNSNTIKEVLLKIISINKGLNEETLNKLLVASGWENNDVQEGMKIFRELSAKTKETSTHTSTNTTVEIDNHNTSNISTTPVSNSQPIIAQVPSSTPHVEIHKLLPPQTSTPMQIAKQDIPAKVETMTKSVPVTETDSLPHIEKIPTGPVHVNQETDLSHIKEKLAALHAANPVTTEKHDMVSTTKTEVAPVLKDNHMDSSIQEKEDTPWGFVLFDVFLFLVAAGLLVFIFIK